MVQQSLRMSHRDVPGHHIGMSQDVQWGCPRTSNRDVLRESVTERHWHCSQDGGTLDFSSTTTEEKWIAGRWSPRGSEVKRIGREEGNPWGRSLTLSPLPQEENESESMIEDKISDFLHCEVRATGKIYPVWYTPVVFSWMLQGGQIFCQESESEAKVKQISQLVAGV